jgi:hypothetical protein
MIGRINYVLDMREKLHDVIHFETGEILREEMLPADVAIFLRLSSELIFHHIEQNNPTQRTPDGGCVDDVYVTSIYDKMTEWITAEI